VLLKTYAYEFEAQSVRQECAEDLTIAEILEPAPGFEPGTPSLQVSPQVLSGVVSSRVNACKLLVSAGHDADSSLQATAA
jgi:hypothetical protein